MPGSFGFSNRTKYSPSECGSSVSVGKRTRFPGGVTLCCLSGFFPALGDLVLDLSAAGSCAPFAGLWVRGRQLGYVAHRDTAYLLLRILGMAQPPRRRSAVDTQLDGVYVMSVHQPKKISLTKESEVYTSTQLRDTHSLLTGEQSANMLQLHSSPPTPYN